jgi:hypothetical protein
MDSVNKVKVPDDITINKREQIGYKPKNKFNISQNSMRFKCWLQMGVTSFA